MKIFITVRRPRLLRGAAIYQAGVLGIGELSLLQVPN
jgi:hypothetical protein